jgi:predicted RNA polymerase sigma factor
MTTDPAAHGAVEAVWRLESARIIASLARLVRDVGLAEELAQDALVAALEQWPSDGIPANPGGWLMLTARHRAIDRIRRNERLGGKLSLLGRELEIAQHGVPAEFDAVLDEERIDDDLLRLMFISCHPVLSTEARIALTLRLLGGLTTEEIARGFLAAEPTIAKRIVRAKRTLASRQVPFEVPPPSERPARLASVLEVLYLVFNEGYSAMAGDDWMRPALCTEALRLSRVLAGLMPAEPEVHGLLALMEIQASRIPARLSPAGLPVPLLETEPRPLGPAVDQARFQRPAPCRAALPPPGPVRAAGGHRSLSRPGAHRRGDRVGADRGALSGPGRAHAVPGGGTKPCGRGGDGVRPGARPGHRGPPDARTRAGRLPSPA